MLYIVATPIGNLDDITIRAIQTLKSVDLILAEDTRHSKYLLQTYEIQTPVRAFHEHNERNQTSLIIKDLLSGQNIALISDAGTPLISDPGFVLVRDAKKAGIKVCPIVGASALIAALSASGIPSDNFSFFGFFPVKKTARINTIRSIANTTSTAIFYESPKRILATAKDLQQVLGPNREACFAKEISKMFENIQTAPLSEIINYLQADSAHQKGEFVVLISANTTDNNQQELDRILPILLSEMSASKAAKLASKITKIEKKICYKKTLSYE